MDVVCRQCKGRYHETTDRYDPKRVAIGYMFRLKDKYRQWGWTSFMETGDTVDANICCPQCNGPYCDVNGKVQTVEPDEKLYQCPHCTFMAKTVAGLGSHKRKHKTQ